jgi:HK97 family phage portal protein
MKFFNYFKKSQKRLTAQDLLDLIGSYPESNSGIAVTPLTAMQCSAVFACIRVLSESIGQIPLKVYKTGDGSKDVAKDFYLYDLLRWQPNDFQTAFDLKVFIILCLCLRGNFYGYINWIGSGKKKQISEILPLHPDNVTPKQSKDWGIIYNVKTGDNKPEVIKNENIWHIKGLSLDGFTGVSPIKYQKESIGLALATEKHGSNLFKRGGRPSGTIEHPGELSKPAIERILAGWNAAHGGSKQGGTALLEEGMKYKTISMTNEDAQFLETRKYQRSEIAGMFRVPLHMIGDLEKSSFSNIEHQGLEFVKYSLGGWVVNIELSVRKDLLTEDQKKTYFAEFLVDALERGDISSRYQAYSTGIEKGILSPNECRAKENLNPRDGGDDFLRPMNMEISGDENGGDPVEDPARVFRLRSKANSINARNQLREGYKKMFASAMQKVVSNDVWQIRANIGKNIKNRSNFTTWLNEYYDNSSGAIKKEIFRILKNYALLVKTLALQDVDFDGEINGFSEFIDERSGNVSLNYIKSNINQLLALLQETETDELKAVLLQRLEEWEKGSDTRPAKSESWAEDEVVKTDNAVSRFCWAAAGVISLIWRTQGRDTCPFCKQMNGKKVGIKEPFIEKDSFLEADDGSGLKIRGIKNHPPIHKGCKCIIIPG